MRYHRVRSPALVRVTVRTALLYWCVLSLTFALLRLAPGDPATFLLPAGATASDAARLRSELELDRPVPVQYARWAGRTLRGDLGRSFADRRPVTQVIGNALPVSLALGGASLALSFIVGAAAGIIQAARRGRTADYVLTVVSVVLAASPAYWLGLAAIACFTYLASTLDLPLWMRLPAVGMTTPGVELHGLAHIADLIRHSIVPVSLLAAIGAAGVVYFLALLAHLALFPLLATVGNVSSVLWPVPVRGMRLRRVRGSGPVGSRMFALLLLSLAAWGPFAVAAILGLPAAVAYLGLALAMSIAYGGLLAFAAGLFESRRESLVAALSQDE